MSKIYPILAILAIFLAGCKKDEIVADLSVENLTEEKLTLESQSATGGSVQFTVRINSNVGAEKIIVNELPAWITAKGDPTLSNGVVSYSYEALPNTAMECTKRSFTLTYTSGSSVAQFPVEQKPDLSMTINNNVDLLGYEGGTSNNFTIEVLTTRPLSQFQIIFESTTPWLTVVNEQPNGKQTGHIFTFRADENLTGGLRSELITFFADGITAEITVQQATGLIEILTTSIPKQPSTGTPIESPILIEVKTNIPIDRIVATKVSDEPLAAPTLKEGTSDTYIYQYCAPATEELLEYRYELNFKCGTMGRSITFWQEAHVPDLPYISIESYNIADPHIFAATGASRWNVMVASSFAMNEIKGYGTADIIYHEDVRDWVSFVSQADYGDTYMYLYKINANPSSERRSATIRFTSPDGTVTADYFFIQKGVGE